MLRPRSEAELLAQGLLSCTECACNHTTLEALKSDRGVTNLQLACPAPFSPELVAFALPLVQCFDEPQLSFEQAADPLGLMNPGRVSLATLPSF